MEKFKIVPAGRVYANQMAPHLRPGDVMEVYRASGLDPLEALLESIELSDDDMCWAAHTKGCLSQCSAQTTSDRKVNPCTKGSLLEGYGCWLRRESTTTNSTSCARVKNSLH